MAEIKTCEQYVLATLEERENYIKELEARIEVLEKCEKAIKALQKQILVINTTQGNMCAKMEINSKTCADDFIAVCDALALYDGEVERILRLWKH